MLLLVVLARHAEEAVTRADLFDELWADSVSGDEALTQAISKLRKALDDAGATASLIQTVRKVGYRLTEPVFEYEGRGSTHGNTTPIERAASREKAGPLGKAGSSDEADPRKPRVNRLPWKTMIAACLVLFAFTHVKGVAIHQHSEDESGKVRMIRMVVAKGDGVQFEKQLIEAASADSMLNSPTFSATQ